MTEAEFWYSVWSLGLFIVGMGVGMLIKLRKFAR